MAAIGKIVRFRLIDDNPGSLHYRCTKMTCLSYWFICSLILLIEEAGTVYADNNSKNVCSGDSIQLFQNITIDSIDKVVSLYMNASRNRLIGMWTWQTLQNGTIADGYSKKVFLDKYGDLWIRNVYSSDEAQYILKYGSETSFVSSSMDLIVHAPPTTNCKPKIQRLDHALSASLDPSECGRPLASVEWLDYPGIRNEGEALLMLPQEKNAGTYYACISGPAVRCARTLKLSSYCSAITLIDSQDSKDIKSEPGVECSPSKYSLAMLIAIFLVLFFGLIILFLSKCINITLCPSRKKAKYVGNSYYDAVRTDTALPDIKVEKKSKIIYLPARESYSYMSEGERPFVSLPLSLQGASAKKTTPQLELYDANIQQNI